MSWRWFCSCSEGSHRCCQVMWALRSRPPWGRGQGGPRGTCASEKPTLLEPPGAHPVGRSRDGETSRRCSERPRGALLLMGFLRGAQLGASCPSGRNSPRITPVSKIHVRALLTRGRASQKTACVLAGSPAGRAQGQATWPLSVSLKNGDIQYPLPCSPAVVKMSQRVEAFCKT